MAKVYGDVVIDVERCKGCELCVIACPEKTLELAEEINKKGYHPVKQVKDNCTGCASCALVCPDAVLTVYRKIEK